MLARIILAYIIALPAFVGIAASRSGGHSLVVTMTSTVPGTFQVFFDLGRGFANGRSSVQPASASDEPREYSAPMPSGQYRQIRIVPGTAPGRYAIMNAVVRAADGSVETVLPLSSLTASELTTIDRSAARLALEVMPGAADPGILYAPPQPLEVPVDERISPGTVGRLALAWSAALLVVLALEWCLRTAGVRASRVLDRLVGAASARPRTVILGAALAATTLSTYPLLLLGRSLVSPNNGGMHMLYDVMPYVPASSDVEIEDTRESDVGAAMWAFLPYLNVQRAALRSGEWPLWNRYNAAGRPLWGQGQTFLFDPLHWLALITPDPALGWDLKFVAHRFVFAVGIGLAALAMTGAWFPAALAAFSAPFVGVYAYRVNHPAIFALTYAPWLLLAWHRLARSRSGGERAGAAFTMACATSLLLFAAPPKEAVASILAMCTAGGIMVWLAAGGWRDRLRNTGAALVAGVVVVLVTAAHWLIFLDTWKVCATAYDVPYAEVGDLATVVAMALGPLTPGPVLPGVHVLTLVLTLAALAAPRRLWRNRAVSACAVGAGACMVVAFGLVPERWLLETPFIGNIGHLHDVFITAAIPLFLMVAAAGASGLRAAGRLRILTVTGLVAAAAAFLLFRVVILAPRNAFEPWAALFVLGLGIGLPWCLARGRRPSVLPALAALPIVLGLVLPGGLHGRSGLATLDAVLVQPRPRVTLDTNSPAVDSLHRAATEPARAFGTNFTLLAGSQGLYEIEGLGGPDALTVPQYDELVNAGGISRASWLTTVGFNEVGSLGPLLDLLNARYVLTESELVPPGVDEMGVSGRDRLWLGRRDSAWPRAFFVDGISQYTDPGDLLRRVATERKPFAAVQDGDSRAILASDSARSPSGHVIPARNYTLSTNTTSFVLDASGPGVAVLTETFLPDDFVATLNGRIVPYFRVNHVFKGLMIPSAGEWRVSFEYRPRRWHDSLALSGLGAVGLAGLGFMARRRGRRAALVSAIPGPAQT